MKRWQQRLRALDWRSLVWYAFGYMALAFFEICLAGAIYWNKQLAGINCLVLGTILMWILPPHGDFSWKAPKTWVILWKFLLFLLLAILFDAFAVHILIRLLS